MAHGSVYQVAMKKASGFNIMSVAEFLAMQLSERVQLVLQGKIQFLSESGDVVPVRDAMRSISQSSSA